MVVQSLVTKTWPRIRITWEVLGLGLGAGGSSIPVLLNQNRQSGEESALCLGFHTGKFGITSKAFYRCKN